jgi:hypothetical protein
MPDNSLAKINIHAYLDKEFKKKDKDAGFTIPVNPESFKKNFKIELDNRKGHGSSASKAKFKSRGTEEIQFDFVLDGTKTIVGYHKEYIGKTVQEQLELLLKCVYCIAGDIHKPRYLIIFWGELLKFKCVLSNLDINYTLFNPDGSPLRAKISTTFISYQTPKESEAKNRCNSPDLTHYRKAASGDRLDWMTYQIYGDPNYILQIAKNNTLTSLRNIRPGTEVIFPPFNSKEN